RDLLHMFSRRVKRLMDVAALVERIAGMYVAGIEQDQAIDRREPALAVVDERLTATVHHRDHVILVAVAWIAVQRVKRLQTTDIERAMMPQMAPFIPVDHVSMTAAIRCANHNRIRGRLYFTILLCLNQEIEVRGFVFLPSLNSGRGRGWG